MTQEGRNNAQHYSLCISLRGSERVPTAFGVQLDALRDVEPEFARLRAWMQGRAAPRERLESLLATHGATSVLRWQAGAMFEMHAAAEVQQRTIHVDVDGVRGTFALAGWTAWFGSHRTMDATEGDDLLFVLPLRREPEGAAELALAHRPANATAAADWLRQAGVLPASAVPRLSGRLGAGFYLVGLPPPAGRDGWIACCAIAAYLFRCYLACQRAERLLAQVRSNGDWDEEYRKLLLARKKLVAIRKNALLKNRARPDSPLLPCFHAAMDALRLPEQIEHLCQQAEDAGKVLEAQSLYVAARRIQAIQAIAFASTVLGLAVALNAIQMPPFYDAGTSNALGRPVFWAVVAVVVGAGLLAWAAVSHWSRARRVWRRRPQGTEDL